MSPIPWIVFAALMTVVLYLSRRYAVAANFLKTHVWCDRHKDYVEGSIVGSYSSGVYVTEGNCYWARFANPGESVICDDCMWRDQRYIAIYGLQPCLNAIPAAAKATT